VEVAAEHRWTAAAPTGRVAYADVRDLSEAAALVLRDPTLHGRSTTSPAPTRTLPGGGDIVDQDPGHEVTYLPVSEQHRRGDLLAAAGTPQWYADLLVSLDTGAESGHVSGLTTTLRDMLGRAPRSVEEFLTENAAKFSG
jgi:hypothetical protein